MCHIRRQTLGNIFNSLFFVMRVFLNIKSVTYIFLKDQGMIIFDLKKNDYKLLGIELNKEEKQINKKIVLSLRGREVINEKTKSIIDLHDSFIKLDYLRLSFTDVSNVYFRIVTNRYKSL
tara:strand:- start:260 stop:619 length:360 start_codon:yes stop_codon:yes gene_type:complete